jgi:hypothetical protein
LGGDNVHLRRPQHVGGGLAQPGGEVRLRQQRDEVRGPEVAACPHLRTRARLSLRTGRRQSSLGSPTICPGKSVRGRLRMIYDHDKNIRSD